MASMDRRLAVAGAATVNKKLEEPVVAVEVARKGIRPGGALFISSSMPIRDLDMYASVVGGGQQAVVALGCNRGASGIDGVLSSALGFSSALARPVTLLIGDTALLHDIGALQAVASAKHPMTIVVVNNGGCGIFNFLPIAKHSDVFEKFFANPHSTDLGAAAAAFGIKFLRASSPAELDVAFNDTLKGSAHVLIEAVTEMSNVIPVHRELGAAARRAAEQTLEEAVDLSYHWHGLAVPGRPVLMLLHGFLGCSADWDPLLSEIAKHDGEGYSCLVVDLPGHGSSSSGRGQLPQVLAVSWEATVALLLKLLDRLQVSRCALVGYSLGGRLALQLAAEDPKRFWAVCSIGGNPGLEDPIERLKRRDADAVLACQLRGLSSWQRSNGTPVAAAAQGEHMSAELLEHEVSAQRKGGFIASGKQQEVRWREWLHTWYKQPLFGDLRRCSSFSAIIQRREHSDPAVMADVLQGSSPGRVPSTWGVVERSSMPLLFAHGACDTKFAAIATQVAARAAHPAAGHPSSTGAGSAASTRIVRVSSIEGAAHAVLEEAPEACAKTLVNFLQEVLSSDAALARSAAYKCAEREPLMIASAGVRTLKLRLKEPLLLSSGAPLTMREGCLLEIGTMSGHVGIGECTPLPAFHKESLEDARAQLLVVADLLHGRIIQPDLALLTEGALAKWLVSPQRFCFVLFC